MKEKLFWAHEHTFGQDQKQVGERRALIVLLITATMMVGEVAAGWFFGSMALLADGLHMASHSSALLINVYAYIYARKHARSRDFSFGTGKVNALGGYTGAVLLAVFALLMTYGSVERILHPVHIAFNQAICVAVLGLVVNALSLFILGDKGHSHAHHHGEDEPHHHDHDHNLKSAYYHVLADALTSILAIGALLAAKYFAWIWMDPLMGLVGVVLVCRWAWGLVKSTSAILLDKQASLPIRQAIIESLQKEPDTRIQDLHVWMIGPDIYGVILSILAKSPQAPEHYKNLLPQSLGLEHVTIEVSSKNLDR